MTIKASLLDALLHSAKSEISELKHSFIKIEERMTERNLGHCKEEARSSTKANANRTSPDSQQASTVFQRATTTCSSCKGDAEKGPTGTPRKTKQSSFKPLLNGTERKA
jgi:hypothetical protein